MASSTEFIISSILIGGAISLVFFLAQQGMTDINPSGTQFYDCQKGLYGRFTDGSGCLKNSTIVLNADLNNTLPTANSQVSATGNIFTDTFTSAKDWLINKLGLGYILDIVSIPQHILITIGLPSSIAGVLASLWYMVVFFALGAWLLGR